MISAVRLLIEARDGHYSNVLNTWHHRSNVWRPQWYTTEWCTAEWRFKWQKV